MKNNTLTSLKEKSKNLFLTDYKFIVANVRNAGHKIIYCNEAFCIMTGFSRTEILQVSKFMNENLDKFQTIISLICQII